MRLNVVMKVIIGCSSKQLFGILKTLQTINNMNYSELAKTTPYRPSNFAYYLRKLVKFEVVAKNPITKTYHLTERGLFVIRVLEQYSEKFISDSEELCKNDNDTSHDFITFCRNCGFQPKPVKGLEKLRDLESLA